MQVMIQRQISPLMGKSYFSQEDILQSRSTIQKNWGVSIELRKANSIEIILCCQNINKYECGLKYLFRKKDGDQLESEYILLTEFQSHHPKCLEPLASNTHARPDILASPSFKRYKPELDPQNQSISLNLINLLHFQENTKKTSQKLERLMNEQNVLLQTKHANKFYIEGKTSINTEEVSMLKKQLQFQSKGLISKSTQFHFQLGYITKISFKCKYQGNNCPYLSTLTYSFERNTKNQKLYKLEKINRNHLSICILDDQEIHYNAITRRIDESLPVLIKIIQHNSLDMKPKRVLQLFSQELEQENSNFIYNGIATKINKRAVKKYFDNSVAKARNMLK